MSDPSFRICVVCAGNICRSPMGEVVLRARVADAGLADDVLVDSAGTGDWHVGSGAHPRSVAALARRGYGVRHRARRFDPGWFEDRDLVLAMDRWNLSDLRRLAPPGFADGRLTLFTAWTTGADVPDPYNLDDSAYDHALDLVEDAAVALVAALPGLLSEAALGRTAAFE